MLKLEDALPMAPAVKDFRNSSSTAPRSRLDSSVGAVSWSAESSTSTTTRTPAKLSVPGSVETHRYVLPKGAQQTFDVSVPEARPVPARR